MAKKRYRTWTLHLSVVEITRLSDGRMTCSDGMATWYLTPREARRLWQTLSSDFRD